MQREMETISCLLPPASPSQALFLSNVEGCLFLTMWLR